MSNDKDMQTKVCDILEDLELALLNLQIAVKSMRNLIEKEKEKS